MRSYEYGRALVYIAEQIIKTFGKDFGLEAQEPKQEPKEPLIKDEKVRKAVRAWAEANDIDSKHYHDNNVKFDFLEHRLKWIETSIEFNDIKGLEYLEDGWEYSIAELCGEESLYRGTADE